LIFNSSANHNGFMADHLYLSMWLRGYDDANMLQHWKTLIETFPLSATAQGIRSLTIYPFNWSETPVFERSFASGTTAQDAVDLASEFRHDDYAYEVEATWDLWVPTEPAAALDQDSASEALSDQDWHLAPVAVTLACTGPNFDADSSDDRAHIQVNFGLDLPFVPDQGEDEEHFDDEADVRARQNLQQLIEFVHRLDEALPVEKRLLWCESGESLADKIMEAWNER
jgi:hypothetical protein